jgi:hypothetical protein
VVTVIGTTVTAATKQTNVILSFHKSWALVVLLYSLFLGLWGLFLYVTNRNPSGSFLGALIIAEAVAVLQGIVGIVLLLQGHRPPEALHYLYGIVAVLTLPSAYFLGEGGAVRRDSLLFGLAGLFLVLIAIRAMTTGTGS